MEKKTTAAKSPSEKAQRPKKTARNTVLGAIRNLKNPKGSSLADIRKYASTNYKEMDVPDPKDLKLFLVKAVDQGILTKVDGKYMIKEAAGRPKGSRSKSPVKRERRSGSRGRSIPKTRSGSKQRSRSKQRSKSKQRSTSTDERRAKKSAPEHVE